MSEATPVEPRKTQEASEAMLPKPREPLRRRPHLLKKAGKKKKKGEKREAPPEPDRDHSRSFSRGWAARCS